jgi:cobalt-zinc-cadmium resistance protein CzcA
MTFSISAGVGFIALFGIAVLNGIVLVEFLNELKEREIKDISERILIATKMRLRPVILTASAAALGFFPMAFSTSAGAEVQRPLATVVIGGLVSATLLTLVILPIIYMIIESRQQNKQQKSKVVPNIVKVILFFIVAGVISNPTHAQVKTVNIDDAVKIAFENNSGLLASSLDVERFEKLERTAFSFEKTQIFYNYEENNFGSNGLPLNVFGISQTFEFPTVYGKRSRYLKEFTGVSQLKYSMDKRELEKKVRQSYYKTLFYLHKEALMQELDSLYEQFKIASNRRYELGETNRLEKITVEIKQKEIDLLAKAAETEVKISYQHLSSLLQIDEPFEIQITPLEKLELPEQQQAGNIDSTQMLAINYQRQMVEASYAHLKLQRSKWLPDIFGGYSYGYGQGENATNYPAYQVGIGIPILWGEQKGNLQAAEVFVQIKENELRNFEKSMTSKLNQLYLDFAQVKEALVYYESDGLQAADEMIEMAQKSFVNGETGYLEFVLSLETAQNFKLMHLDLLNQYNQLALEIMYFTKPQDIEP